LVKFFWQKVGETFFAFQVFMMIKVCDEFFYEGTKMCENRFFHAKVFHEIFSCLTVFVMQIVLWGKRFKDKKSCGAFQLYGSYF
jgi:hypothetical protein